jgi:signal transduction histidine kinase
MRNAFHHAGASRIEVLMHFGADDFVLRVTDDGAGFDPAAGHQQRRHFGLTGMRERAQRIGARFDISSAPGAGTRVTVSVPECVAYRSRPRQRWLAWLRRLR